VYFQCPEKSTPFKQIFSVIPTSIKEGNIFSDTPLYRENSHTVCATNPQRPSTNKTLKIADPRIVPIPISPSVINTPGNKSRMLQC